jgi:sulfonate transport system permease protein
MRAGATTALKTTSLGSMAEGESPRAAARPAPAESASSHPPPERRLLRPRAAVDLLLGLVLPAVLLVLWHWASQQGAGAAFAFVPLKDILAAARELLQEGHLWVNVGASAWTMLQGLAWGLVVGVAVGAAMAYWRVVGDWLHPLVQALRQVPNLALIPLVALWFGNSEFSKMLVVSLAVFEVIVLNTYEGLHHADPRHLEVARALTLSRRQTFLRVRFPAALPALVTGLQHGVAFAWLSTVGAELLFTVGPGLSSVMERAQTAARMEVVIVCLGAIALLGLVMNQAVRWIGQRVLRWQHSAYPAR